MDVYYTRYRNYDPAIGIWWEADPKVDNFYRWTPYNFSYNNPVRYNDPDGDCGICPVLRKLARQGVKWAARTVKGQIKQVSRKQAVKMIEKNGTLYQVEKGSNKVAKALLKEAKPAQKMVRHDGHKLANGKTGMDHFQPKTGGGSHVNYMKGTAGAAMTNGASSEENVIDDPDGTGEGASNLMENTIQAISNSIPEVAAMGQAANAGKSVLGDNAVGNFVDDCINPFGMGKDVMDLAIIGGILISK